MIHLPSTIEVPFHLLRQYVCETTEVSTQASMRLVLTSHSINTLVTVCKRSWDKVIFSEACVKNFVHRGGSASVHTGIADPREQTPHPGSRPTLRSACWEIRQQASGTHPTGMQSCFFIILVQLAEYFF